MTWQELMQILRTLAAMEGYLANETVDKPNAHLCGDIGKCLKVVQREMLKHTEVK